MTSLVLRRLPYNLTAPRRFNMELSLFDDLVQSLKEAKSISTGEVSVSRRFEVLTPDVRASRVQTGLPRKSAAKLGTAQPQSN
jgi:hypothetical protein